MPYPPGNSIASEVPDLRNAYEYYLAMTNRGGTVIPPPELFELLEGGTGLSLLLEQSGKKPKKGEVGGVEGILKRLREGNAVSQSEKMIGSGLGRGEQKKASEYASRFEKMYQMLMRSRNPDKNRGK